MKKTALVIGVKSYKKGVLYHTINDAQDMRDSLSKIGFTVFPYFDISKDSLDGVINAWINKVGDYQVALFYFSGHGCESPDGNYLFPADANPSTESELKWKCISANSILERMTNSSTKYNVMILDACRDNPFTKGWARGSNGNIGLTAMEGTGAFIGFAAAPGKTASDGAENERNGIYTGAILKNITIPNKSIERIFTDVNAAVRINSSGKQVPYMTSSLSAEFCFSVSHKKSENRNKERNGFIQPSSSVFLSSDEEEIIAIDNELHEISIRDANSFAKLSSKTVSSSFISVVCSSARSAYLIDSTQKSITIISLKNIDSTFTIAIPGFPRGIAIAPDEKRGFVIYTDSLKNGYVGEIDLQCNAVTKSTLAIPNPSSIVISTDGRMVYVISNTNKECPLFSLDVRSYKSKVVNNIASGYCLGISPDNRKVYTSFNTTNQTNIIEASSLKIVNSLPLKSSAISFTKDNKYALLSQENTLTVVGVEKDLMINNVSLFNPTKGIATTEDGRIIVWIPKEHSLALIDSGKLLKTIPKMLTDIRVQEYNQKMEKYLRSSIDSAAVKILNQIRDTIWAFSAVFSKQLIGRYDVYNNFDYFSDKDSINVYTGLSLLADMHRRIVLSIHLKYDHGNIKADFSDQLTGENGRFDKEFHSENFDWNTFKQTLGELYLQRINTQLILRDKT